MKNLLFIAVFITSFTLTAQTKVAGVEIPTKINYDETILELNGAGVRSKYFMDMYVCGLYVTEKNKNDSAIIQSDKTMAIKLHIVSSLITTDKMIAAVDTGFKNSTKGKQAELKTEINKFKAVFSPEIKQNDVYDFIYSTERGTVVYKNSKAVVTIKGLEFKKALFGIWLCNEPADKGLKSAMLGK